MGATAAGTFRRTPIERSDQRVSWERADHAFFAAGACHILAWACRDVHPGEGIGLAAMSRPGDPQPIHVYATWREWAFDFSGWHSETELLRVNAAFEDCRVTGTPITTDLAGFCRDHLHRMPHQYWRDPLPRARAYLGRFDPPWTPRPAKLVVPPR